MRFQKLTVTFAAFALFVLCGCTSEVELLRKSAKTQHDANDHAQAVRTLHEGLTKLREENGGILVDEAEELERQRETYAKAELEKLLRVSDFEGARAWLTSYEGLVDGEVVELRTFFLDAAKASLAAEKDVERQRSIIVQALNVAPKDPDLLQARVHLEIEAQRWDAASEALNILMPIVSPPPGMPVTLPPSYSDRAFRARDVIQGELLLKSIQDMLDPTKGCPTPEDLMATWRKAKSIEPSTPAYSKVRELVPTMETCRQGALNDLKSEFKDKVVEMRRTLASRLTQDAAFQFFGARGLVSAKAEGKKADVLKLRYGHLSLSDMQSIARSDKNDLATKYFRLLAMSGFRKVIWIDAPGEQRCAYTRRVLNRPCTVFHPLKPTSFKESYDQMLKEERWDQPFKLPEATSPPATPPKSAQGQLAPSPPTKTSVVGSLTTAEVLKVIDDRKGGITSCQAKGANTTGFVRLKFMITGTGSIMSAVPLETDLDQKLTSCLTKRLRLWSFPEPKGGGIVVVKHTFHFRDGVLK